MAKQSSAREARQQKAQHKRRVQRFLLARLSARGWIASSLRSS
jgi:hypothetical protein